MKKYLVAFLAVIIYAVAQILCGMAAFALNAEEGANKLDVATEHPMLIAVTVAVSAILAVLVISLMKNISWKTAFDGFRCSPGAVCLAILGGLLVSLGMNVLQELVNLEDLTMLVLKNMTDSVVGIIAIAIVGPICEELVFREGIQGYLQRNGAAPWVAIIFSSICFGLIHMNPAQTYFAVIMGLVLSILYWRTGNVMLCSLLHILNNSLAVVQIRMTGDDYADFRLTDALGGTSIAIPVAIVSLILAIVMLARFAKQTKPQLS